MKVYVNNTEFSLEQEPNIIQDRVSFNIPDSYDIALVEATITNADTVRFTDDDGNVIGLYSGLSFFALTVIAGSGIYSIEFLRSNELHDLQDRITATDNKVDSQNETINSLSEQVNEITPYTDTKTAYIDDTEVTFNGVPSGALLVSFSNGNTNYSISKEDGNLTIGFAPFDEIVEITISVQ